MPRAMRLSSLLRRWTMEIPDALEDVDPTSSGWVVGSGELAVDPSGEEGDD